MSLDIKELDNFKTNINSRVESDKNVSSDRIRELIETAKDSMKNSYSHVTDINGVPIELITDSKHLIDFWKGNWKSTDKKPKSKLYAATEVEDKDPFAYYCEEEHTAVFLNTDYYGQVKSWALGMVAAYLEPKGWHSIHGACVEIRGKGIVIVAPTGTGKSTLAYMLFSHENGYILGDDWIYIKNENYKFTVVQPEKKLYMRTNIAKENPELSEIFKKCKLENVGETFWSNENSRALVSREWIAGEEYVKDETNMDMMVLLRRDDHSPPIEELDVERAIEILKKGEYQILPGAGSKEDQGKTGYQPWYNPYLLHNDNKQEEFFRKELENCKCIILNTGKQTPQESFESILKFVDE